MGGSGGYRRLPGGAQEVTKCSFFVTNTQTLIIIYISPSSSSSISSSSSSALSFSPTLVLAAGASD